MRLPKARLQLTKSARRSTLWLADLSPRPFLGGCRSSRLRVRQRNADHKCTAGPRFVVPALNFAPVSADNAIANAQPQARSFTGMFRGVERIKNALRIDDARAVIGYVHFDGLIAMRGSNGNPPTLAGFLDGVVGVIQNIQKNLLQLLSISQRRRERFIKFF